eukprot:CAMPEP_0202354706 /NCGR_PEP_ID=MMETSP1126-20121109/9911_1 /ASSEMBLY_ACC=CAM_ASM_000457 /TAXON_ID=3047 /ORGANISM="Dunaliella tertiolecta, Strain CCMP1320" /LENGTH=235 /DNA_ID=CAMNT_0048947211 /DNA_START=132 /DNA_END=839 /DNA_ORIENTATION=+
MSSGVRTHAVGFGQKTAKDVKGKDAPVVDKLEWERPLQIVKYPDPRLRAVNARINCFDDSLVQLAKEMIEIMYQDDGVGLAAPQVGVNVRLMVFNPYGSEKPGNESILVNPEVVESSRIKGTGEEGCLSFPKIYGEVERPRDVVVHAQNEKGEPISLNLGGSDIDQAWISRIFQHEYDHLQGVLFHDRMRPNVIESNRKQLVALEEAFISANPGVPVKRIPPPKAAKGFGAMAKR